jgi:hypothetical protein
LLAFITDYTVSFCTDDIFNLLLPLSWLCDAC